MRCKAQRSLHFAKNCVNKKSNFQTSQKMLEVKVAVKQFGKCFEGGNKPLLVKRSVAESKMMMGKWEKLKKNSGISIKTTKKTTKIHLKKLTLEFEN